MIQNQRCLLWQPFTSLLECQSAIDVVYGPWTNVATSFTELIQLPTFMLHNYTYIQHINTLTHAHYQAIENDEMSALKQAIQEMKESADGSSASLNTCRLIKKSGVTYSMSLLALCGFHERKEMVDLLLKEGAGTSTYIKAVAVGGYVDNGFQTKTSEMVIALKNIVWLNT